MFCFAAVFFKQRIKMIPELKQERHKILINSVLVADIHVYEDHMFIVLQNPRLLNFITDSA